MQIRKVKVEKSCFPFHGIITSLHLCIKEAFFYYILYIYLTSITTTTHAECNSHVDQIIVEDILRVQSHSRKATKKQSLQKGNTMSSGNTMKQNQIIFFNYGAFHILCFRNFTVYLISNGTLISYLGNYAFVHIIHRILDCAIT